MANISKLKMIEDKLRAISLQIVQQREVLNGLEAQERDLETAKRVLTSLEAEVVEAVAAVDITDAAVIKPQPGKPEGIPTMPQMILEALYEAKARGVRGLEPKEIANFIAQKWWPAVTINAVGPIAWRMHKGDRLSKRQSKYSLPKVTDETAVTNVAA
jgi:hypothetical protein